MARIFDTDMKLRKFLTIFILTIITYGLLFGTEYGLHYASPVRFGGEGFSPTIFKLSDSLGYNPLLSLLLSLGFCIRGGQACGLMVSSPSDTQLHKVRPRQQDDETASWFHHGAPALLFRLSRVFGVAPIVFAGNHVRISRALIPYGLILIFTTSGIIIWFLVQDIIKNQAAVVHSAQTTRFVLYVQNVTSVFLNFITVFLAPGRIRSLIEIVQRVESVKTKLNDISRSREIKTNETRLIVLYFIAFIIFYCVGISCNLPYITTKDVPTFLFKYSMQFSTCMMTILVTMQLIMACRYIGPLLTHFNRCLRHVLHSIDDQEPNDTRIVPDVAAPRQGPGLATANVTSRMVPVSRRSLNRVIDTLALNTTTSAAKFAQSALRDLNVVYMEVCDLVDIMNHRHNGITMLVIITAQAIGLIVIPYNAIRKIMTELVSIPLLVIEICWFCINFFSLWMVINPGHHVIYKTIAIQHTVSKLMGKAVCGTDEFLGEINSLYTKLVLVKPTFSALGVFTLSRKLVISIIAAAATYTVIVVQFLSSEK